MGRKYRNSNRKKHQPYSNFGLGKKHITGNSCINVAAYHFEIKQEVIEILKSYAQHKGDERCGVLTGVQVDEKRYRICKVSSPCVKEHTYSGCMRDAIKANKFIEEDYRMSEHTRFYIGEWHTHPENNPKPSAIDYNSIRDNYHTASLVASFLVMIIVGTQTFHLSVYNGNRFIEIEPEVV